jgi:hypothetical protein
MTQVSRYHPLLVTLHWVNRTPPGQRSGLRTSHLTMSNSAVFFVPAAHFCVRVVASSSHPAFAEASAGK